MPAISEIDVFAARDGILRALRRRSRTPARWSVRTVGGRANCSGLLITAAPRYLDPQKELYADDAAELGRVLALGRAADPSGVRVPATGPLLREYFDRADGRFSV